MAQALSETTFLSPVDRDVAIPTPTDSAHLPPQRPTPSLVPTKLSCPSPSPTEYPVGLNDRFMTAGISNDARKVHNPPNTVSKRDNGSNRGGPQTVKRQFLRRDESNVTGLQKITRHHRNIGLETWGPWGPFNTLTILNLSQDERWMAHYALNVTWKPFGESDAGRERFSQQWMWRMMESRTALYAQLFGAATHRLGSTSKQSAQNSIMTTALRCKGKAIKALHYDLELLKGSPDAAVSDSMMLAIFVLAIHENIDLSPMAEPHPPSPLATHRDMHIYGKMKFKQEHMDALYDLIDRKGGMANIDEPTFGCVIPPADITFNILCGTKPRLPNARSFKPILRTQDWQPDSIAEDLLDTVGGAFRPHAEKASISSLLHLRESMLTSFAVMVENTVALDHFARGGNGAPASLDLLNNCDWVAHLQVSEPTYLPAPGGGESLDMDLINNILSEICRLAGSIYVDMVIFPMPVHSGIKQRLSSSLLPLLLCCEEKKSPLTENEVIEDLLTWATLLGAIGARFTSLESSYINLIASRPTRRSCSWRTIRQRLKIHLWLDSVCDIPAASLWFEAGRFGFVA